MTKEEKREYDKKYYQANKEKKKAYREANKEKQKEYFSKYHKKYYKDNKEQISLNHKSYYEANKEQLKEYYLENKERIDSYRKAWNESNKDKLTVQKKANYESNKDGYYTVYYLKEDHYVGMTTNLTYRLYQHKNKNNRHVEDVEVIGRYETKEGALRVEAALHSMGYLGRHPQLKQQTLKQLL